MTREEAIEDLKASKRWKCKPSNECIDMAIKALEQDPCEDAISRADATKCEKYGLTDADIDKYAVQVQNGEGYYNSSGEYVSYNLD